MSEGFHRFDNRHKSARARVHISSKIIILFTPLSVAEIGNLVKLSIDLNVASNKLTSTIPTGNDEGA